MVPRNAEYNPELTPRSHSSYFFILDLRFSRLTSTWIEHVVVYAGKTERVGSEFGYQVRRPCRSYLVLVSNSPTWEPELHGTMRHIPCRLYDGYLGRRVGKVRVTAQNAVH